MSNIINDDALISELQVTHNSNEGASQAVDGLLFPVGQVITSPSGISKVNSVTLYLNNSLGATGGVKLEINSVSVGLPTGEVIGTSEIVDMSTVPVSGANPVVFEFLDESVSEDSQYAFSIVDDSLTGSFLIFEDTTNYVGGNSYSGGIALAVDYMFDSAFQLTDLPVVGEGYTAGIYEDIELTSSLTLDVENIASVYTLGDEDAALTVAVGGQLRIGVGEYMTVPPKGAYTLRFKNQGDSIKFMSNGGDGADDYTIVYARSVSQSIPTAASMGFSHPTLTFTNWNSDPAGTGFAYADGEPTLSMVAYPNATNLTFYAQWS
jgi:hypothetical protein